MKGRKAMRRFALVVGLMLLSLVVASPAMAATTQAFEAGFNEGFGQATAHPCPLTENFSWCGTGTITGFGEATSFAEVLSFNLDPGAFCGDVVFRRTITLEDGSTLVLMETGTVCFPGKSALAPDTKSFGNPYNVEATFTIVTGTGVFAGAHGGGTDAIKAAGDASKSTLSGSITLP
jgi:hypothetical protein